MHAHKIWTSTGILTEFQAVFSELSYQAFFFLVAQQPNLDLGCLTVEVHTQLRHTHLVGLLWKSGQLITDAASSGCRQMSETAGPLGSVAQAIYSWEIVMNSGITFQFTNRAFHCEGIWGCGSFHHFLKQHTCFFLFQSEFLWPCIYL